MHPSEIRPGTWARGLDPAVLDEPRAAACWVVEETLRTAAPVDAAWQRIRSLASERDRALAYRLATEMLRWALRLDYLLERLSGRRIDQIDPLLLGPLRVGAVQLLFFDRVPAHAAVSTAVGLAAVRSRRGGGFVNAVLRKVAEHGPKVTVTADDPILRLAIESSHPRFLVERWMRRYGEQATRRLVEANNRERRAALLVTGGAERRDEVGERLRSEGLEVEPSALSPLGLLVDGDPLAGGAYADGEIYPQDEASQCAALVPAPAAGERILDAAAAPGGKTLAMLAWERQLRIVAADTDPGRLPRLLENRRRTGARFGILAADARRPPFAAGFDRVVADLPCTGSGTLRKHPELKWRITPGEIERLVGRGAAILRGLAGLVVPGGLLVIVTCSLEPEENEEQVVALLADRPELEPLPLEDRLPPWSAPFVEAPGRWRILPADEHDGFTVHVLRRVDD